MPTEILWVYAAQGGAHMGNTDGNGDTMYEELTHHARDEGFLQGSTYAIGAGEVDPEDED
jgi:hypothetical protein